MRKKDMFYYGRGHDVCNVINRLPIFATIVP